MMQAILNPYKLPQNLFPAEERFVDYLRAGRREGQCRVGTGELPEQSVESDDPNVANVVRSEVICFFAYGGDENNPVKGAFIRLQGAWIRGELDLAHAQIPYALIFHNCHFDSVVNMRHAECRELDLQGSRMQEGLTGDPLWVKGGVRFSKGFVAKKCVWLSSARIGGVLDCSNGEFCGGLGANKAKMEVLVWREVTGGEEIQLKAATADVLEDDLDSWKPFKVDLDGFTYNQFVGQTDVAFRLRWLDNRPDSMEFSPLPYEQAAKVLSGMGHPVDAWDILREKRRLEREHDKPSWLQRAWGRTMDTLTDFVYRPLRTVKWTVGIVLMGAVLFGIAGSQGQIAPHQSVILASEKYQAALYGNPPMKSARAAFPVEYPEFSPLVFSLDVFIPFFALHQEPFWTPASGEEDDLWKSSILLAFMLAVLAALVWLTWAFQDWIRRAQDGVPGPAGAATGMAVVCLALGFDFAAGFVNVFLDFPLEVWLLADWRWLTVWYWLQIMAGWILTSLLLLSVTGLLRPRIGGGD